MKTATVGRVVPLIVAALLAGCWDEGSGGTSGSGGFVFESPVVWSAWSEPVNLGAPINTAFGDLGPCMSKDGRTLYFQSNRTGTFGGTDLWVAHRENKTDPWGTPVNLGSVINTSAIEAGPSLSEGGLLLFFHSDRSGGQGETDIYVTRREDEDDDFGWGTPENLGTDVNTSEREQAPHYQKKGEGGKPSLYFHSGPLLTPDIYVAPLTKGGRTRGPAVAISELNSSASESTPTVSKDGLEVIFASNRAGGFQDLYVSTRGSVYEEWSAPVNLGPPVNTAASEFGPFLSLDGRALLFNAGPARGGSGGDDIWISTRVPIDDDDDDD